MITMLFTLWVTYIIKTKPAPTPKPPIKSKPKPKSINQ
jgi:hypothetical protein